MTPSPTGILPRFRLNALLHPTDFSDDAQVAFHHALLLATAARARLDLLHAEPDNTEVSARTFPQVVETLVRWKLVEPNPTHEALLAAGVRARPMVAPGRDPADAILHEVDAARSDLLVLATHGRSGLARALQPSVTEIVTRSTSVPVLVIPPSVTGFVDPVTGACTLRRILVPVAREPSPDVALDLALAIGRILKLENVTLSTLFVGQESEAPEFRFTLPATWTYHAWNQDSAVVGGIVDSARDWSADLLVMTSSGHDSLLDDVRGSTTDRVIRTASCPVLVVPRPPSS